MRLSKNSSNYYNLLLIVSSRLLWATQNWSRNRSRWWWLTLLIPVFGSHIPLIPALRGRDRSDMSGWREEYKEEETGTHWGVESVWRIGRGSGWLFCFSNLQPEPQYQSLGFYYSCYIRYFWHSINTAISSTKLLIHICWILSVSQEIFEVLCMDWLV